MQTLPDLALEFIGWQRVGLRNGVYRLVNAASIERVRNIDAYTERIDIAQFIDSLVWAKSMLGIAGGVWVGVERECDGITHVVAMRME